MRGLKGAQLVPKMPDGPPMNVKSTMMLHTPEEPPKNLPLTVQTTTIIPRGKKNVLTLPKAPAMHQKPKNEGFADA